MTIAERLHYCRLLMPHITPKRAPLTEYPFHCDYYGSFLCFSIHSQIPSTLTTTPGIASTTPITCSHDGIQNPFSTTMSPHGKAFHPCFHPLTTIGRCAIIVSRGFGNARFPIALDHDRAEKTIALHLAMPLLTRPGIPRPPWVIVFSLL